MGILLGVFSIYVGIKYFREARLNQGRFLVRTISKQKQSSKGFLFAIWYSLFERFPRLILYFIKMFCVIFVIMGVLMILDTIKSH
jgi:hypothetical protein